MKLFIIFIITGFFSLFLFTTCKKKETDNSEVINDLTASNVATLLNLQNSAAFRFQEVYLKNKDTLDALINAGQWLVEQPEISEAYLTNDNILEIHLYNGLRSRICVVPTDENGRHLTRGGSFAKKSGFINQNQLKYGLMHSIFGYSDENHLISNNKVLLFIPYFESFYNSNYHLMSRFDGGSQNLDVSLVTETNADLNVINSFSDYGFIIINTHGHPNGFEILPKAAEIGFKKPLDGKQYTKESIAPLLIMANNLPAEKLANGELELNLSIYVQESGNIKVASTILVTDNYIRNIKKLKDAVVFGNFCYSGYIADGPTKNNLSEAFKSIGAISYYGYALGNGSSDQVSDKFAKLMEDSLITSLVQNLDSTGIAHLENNQINQFESRFLRFKNESEKITAQIQKEIFIKKHPTYQDNLYFKHYFDDNYKYGCGTFTDPRDGEVYKLACIGSQKWFAENLRYNAPNSKIYDNNNSYLDSYGRLYNWETVSAGGVIPDPLKPGTQGICPKGWHVPSRYDWIRFLTAFNVTYDEYSEFHGASVKLAVQLKSKDKSWIYDNLTDPLRNKSGFSALPAGSAVVGSLSGGGTSLNYVGLNMGASFWSSSPLIEPKPGQVGAVKISTYNVNYIELSSLTPVGYNKIDEVYYSCRCVKD